MSPRRPLKRCAICRQIFQPRFLDQRICGEAACSAATPPHPLLGKQVKLRPFDPRITDQRGHVVAVAIVGGRPLLTVRLSRDAWPGGGAIGLASAYSLNENAGRTGEVQGWRCELREEEVELL